MTMTNANRRGRLFTPERLQQIRNLVERGKSREEIAELIGVTVGSLQDTCSRFGIDLRRVVFSNGMGLLRRGGRHSDNGTSTYTGSRGGDVPLPPQSQQNSQEGPVDQPQATTPHEERARRDEMGLANLALRIKYRGERTRMIPMDRKSPVDTHIGQRLKEYRELRGMTVRELADAAHVTPGQISHYEHGRDRISHERVTEFARILRIKSNDLYQPPGSRLRRNHVRWRAMDLIAAGNGNFATLMRPRSRRATAAEDVFALSAAVAVAAVASDAASGSEISSLTTSGDDTAVDISAISRSDSSVVNLGAAQIWHSMAETVTDNARVEVVEVTKLKIVDFAVPKMEMFKADAEGGLQLHGSDAANALLIMDGVNTNLPGHYTGGSSATSVSQASEETRLPSSALSTSANNGFIVTETPKAVTDPKISHLDNFKFTDDGSHPGKASHDDGSHPGKPPAAATPIPAKTSDDDSHPGKTSDAGSHPGKTPNEASSDDSHGKTSHEDGNHPGKTSHENGSDDSRGKASVEDDNHPGKASHDDGSHPGKTSHDDSKIN